MNNRFRDVILNVNLVLSMLAIVLTANLLILVFKKLTVNYVNINKGIILIMIIINALLNVVMD